MTAAANEDVNSAEILADAVARARILNDHATSMLVEAAAGTGKTTALVTRLVAMLKSGACELRNVIIMTFTEKAAGELTLRLRTALEEARLGPIDPDERTRCLLALEQLESARVGTIHGFCTDVLKERPIEAKVDPSFEVLAEEEAQAFVHRALHETFESALARPGDGLRRFLRRASSEGEAAEEQLRDAARKLIDHRDHDAPWRRDPFDRDVEIDALMAELDALAALSPNATQPTDYCARSLARLAQFAFDVAARERVAPRDYDGLEAELAKLVKIKEWGWRGSGKFFAPQILRSAVLERRDALKARLDQFLERANANLAACLRTDLEPVLGRYESLKRQSGVLDFLDLLLATRSMLRDQSAVRGELQQRFTHIFVDEFQDTDPVQADIVLLLAADDPTMCEPTMVRPANGKLFLVGDPKQSIYRFRRADIATYERVKEQLARHDIPVLHLTTSFRSLPGIQRVVNAAFSAAMERTSSLAQAEYVPLTEWRKAEAGRPSVIALGIPRPYDKSDRISKTAIAASTPDAVAAFVAWLVHESGWKVIDPATGMETRVAPQHVCLLFRRQKTWIGDDVVRPYLRGLEARNVPHVFTGGPSFHQREEVIAISAIANAIEYPEDALAVYAALHGPFIALSDADLLLYRDRVGPLHPLHKVEIDAVEPGLRPVAEALMLLRNLHLTRNRHPIADTWTRFFDATRAHASLALARGGEQALASAMRILDMARRFDQRRALSFRGFVTLLEEQAERGDASGGDSPPSEEGQDGVRVMTVFKAKGLEFPVVVLCDPTASTGSFADQVIDSTRREAFFPLARLEPIELRERASHAIADNRAEAVRLTYVAATRARDLLVVPACGDEPFEEAWYFAMNRAIYPEKNAWRQGDGRAPGCPVFGDESVSSRSSEAESRGAISVRPGLHRSIGVVWWDPSTLALEIEPAEGVRSDEVLRPVPSVDGGMRAHRAWMDARAAAIEDGSLPTVRVASARVRARLPNRESGTDPRIERVKTEVHEARPEGRRIESLFRGALEMLQPGDRDEVIATLVRARARACGADLEEERAVVRALSAIARHPWFEEATPHHRNVPIAASDERGIIIQGTIDLIRQENDESIAVRILLTEGEPTEAQRAEATILAAALAEASGGMARASILLV
jgi:ATP-dependent exoDNAse (exonuclease V) beta subunit